MATKPDLSDTLTALKMHLGKVEDDLKYDIDGNGTVDLNDVLGLQKAHLGKDPGFAFAENSYFQSPSTKTAADYAAEKKAEEDRIAFEKAEAAKYADVRLQQLSEFKNKVGEEKLNTLAANQGRTRNYWAYTWGLEPAEVNEYLRKKDDVAKWETAPSELKQKYADANKLSQQGRNPMETTFKTIVDNPNLSPQQLANKTIVDYWSGQSEAYSRVMKAMNDGTAKFTQVPSGVDEYGYTVTTLGLTSDPKNPNSNNSLTLTPTGTPNVYQFSTYNQVAGGNIHGLIAGNPETGQVAPVYNAAQQFMYTPGSSGSFFGNMIGGIGDALKAAGPLPAIIGNMILPGAGSALAAVLALDEGNKTGAVLNALSAGSQMGNTAAQNALSAEVSGNVDLANQYSSGVQGTLAENAGNLKTASNVAQLANAIDQKNVAGALTAAGTLTGAAPSPEIKAGMAVAGLAKALNSGDTATAIALAGQLTGNQDAKVAAQAIKTLDALKSGNPVLAMTEGIKLGKIADPYLKQAKADVLKNANTASTLAEGEIDPSQFDAAELLFGTNAGSLGDASDLAGLQDTGAGSNQMTQEDLVNIVNGGIGDATLTGGTGADTLAGGSLGDASDLAGPQETGTSGNQLTDQELADIVAKGVGDATLTGGNDGTAFIPPAGQVFDPFTLTWRPATAADTTAGGQDSAGGEESTTQGGTSTDTIAGGANTGTTLTGDDGSTITIKPDGTITSTESTLTGGSGASDIIKTTGTGDTSTGTQTTAQPNKEYFADGTYKVTYEDGTSAIFNADGTPYSTVDNTGTNNLSIILDDSSPSGYRDSLGQPVNQDGTPYVAPAGNDTLTGGQSTVTGGQSTNTGSQSTVPGGQSTVPGGQSTVPGGSGGGLNLGALMALLGAGQGQQAPTAPPVVDIGEQLDLEEALQTSPFAKKKTQTKMASGGSIDDLLALLQQRG